MRPWIAPVLGLFVLLHVLPSAHANSALYTWGRVQPGRVPALSTQSGWQLDRAPEVLPHTLANVNNPVYFSSSSSSSSNAQESATNVSTAIEVSAATVNITGIASGKSYSVAWSAVTNELFVWGYNDHGVLCLNNAVAVAATPIPVILPENEVIVKVAAAQSTFALLTQSGRVYTCGAGGLGQLGNGKRIDSPAFVHVAMSDIIDVVAADNTFLVETYSGDFYTWGSNANGLLGANLLAEHVPISTRPVKVEDLSDPTGIATLGSGMQHFYVAKTNDSGNEIYYWGMSKPFQLLAGHTSSRGLPFAALKPQRLPEFEALLGTHSFGSICSGLEHGAFINYNGDKLYTWGSYGRGTLDVLNGRANATYHERLFSELSANNTRIASLACGEDFGLALTANGAVYGWGANRRQQLGNTMQPTVSQIGNQELVPPHMSSLFGVTPPVVIYTDYTASPASAITASRQFAQVVVSAIAG